MLGALSVMAEDRWGGFPGSAWGTQGKVTGQGTFPGRSLGEAGAGDTGRRHWTQLPVLPAPWRTQGFGFLCEMESHESLMHTALQQGYTVGPLSSLPTGPGAREHLAVTTLNPPVISPKLSQERCNRCV